MYPGSPSDGERQEGMEQEGEEEGQRT